MQTLHSVTLHVHCSSCSFGEHLFQISAKPKYTAQTDQLYFGYEIDAKYLTFYDCFHSEQC